ncbi:MAG: pyridoxine 5'-phosphate synthase [Balneolaceae bacterium]
MQLYVNIDHVATLRNARGEGYPDPIQAARVCEEAGAHGIVFHLRGDRRHIQDPDVFRLKDVVTGVLDFEMAATDEMIRICREVDPHLVTFVPENRQELTTEGGLDMTRLEIIYSEKVLPAFEGTRTQVSLFLDPEPTHIDIAARLGVPVIELHTGRYANARGEARNVELQRLTEAAIQAHQLGITVNAGHGLNLQNLPEFLETVPHLNDISIGHALISDALFQGLSSTVKTYLNCMDDHTHQGESGPSTA